MRANVGAYCVALGKRCRYCTAKRRHCETALDLGFNRQFMVTVDLHYGLEALAPPYDIDWPPYDIDWVVGTIALG
jgi:hypothetical protein